MNNEKTMDGLTKLVVLALVIQDMPDDTLVSDKTGLSLALQEVAKFIGDAHGIDWLDLVADALGEIAARAAEIDAAEAFAASAISKAKGHKAR